MRSLLVPLLSPWSIMRSAQVLPACEGSVPTLPGRHVLELRAHRSLTREGARRFIAVVAAGTFGVAAFVAAHGFWPVLVFAALEIGGLIWALHCSMRSGMVSETITITRDDITIAHREQTRQLLSVFPRHWAKVTLHAPPSALHPTRLLVESHGRGCEVGRFLTEDERRSLAIRLKQLVGNVNESPAL